MQGVSIKSNSKTVTPSEVQRLSQTKYPKKLPPIVRNVTNAEDIEAIRSLPSDWEPNVEPSAVLENVASRRKLEHEKCVELLREEMKIVNGEVEEQIRNRAEVFKKCLKDIEIEIEESLARIEPARKLLDKYNPIEKIFIPREVFFYVFADISSNCNQGKRRIEEYNAFLLDLEKGRSSKFKSILRKAYERMHDISHMLPYHIQEFFEYEIMNINQITLSNYRCYEDLKLQLLLKLENDQKLWFSELEECKRIYVEHRRKLIIGHLTSLGLPIDDFDPFEKFVIEISQDGILDEMGLKITPCSLRKYALELSEKLIEYDVSIQRNKEGLYMMIDKIINGNYDEIQQITFENMKIQPNLFVSEIYEECYDSFFEDPRDKVVTAYAITIRDNYVRLLSEIREELDLCKDITQCALHTWDNHFERIFEAKTLSFVDFKHLLNSHSGSEDVEMIKVNTFIDKLRQASTERELNENMMTIRKAFKAIETIILNNHDNELQFFEKFRDYAERESQILEVEMHLCLNKTSANSDVDHTLQRGRASQLNILEVNMDEVKLPLILRYENEVKSLHNWIYGLKETMLLMIDKCKVLMLENADKWIKVQTQTLTRKVRVKIDNLVIQAQRIFFNVYKVRLAELRFHREIYQAHKLGVVKEANSLQREFQKRIPKLECLLESCKRSFSEIELRMEQTKTSGQVAGLILQTKIVKAMKTERIKQLKDDYLSGANPIVNSIKCATFEYLNHLKLFVDGGNYSAGELKLLKSELSRIAKTLEKDVSKVLITMDTEITKSFGSVEEESTKLTTSLIKLEAEFKFSEDALQEIKDVQSAIRATTNDLLRNCKLIEKYYEQLQIQAKRHLGDLNYLEEFAMNAEYTENAFRRTRCLLVQVKPFTLNMDLFIENRSDGGRFYLIENLSRVLIDADNIVGKLLGDRPTHEDLDYMSMIIKILYDSMLRLRTLAKARFSDGSDGEKLKDFLIELAAKYLYYQLQCEEVWLEVSLDYLLMVDKVSEFIKYYYSESIIRFLENSLIALKSGCNGFADEIKIDKENVDRNYYALHGKLKPLHGHPSNGKLLDDLHVEMDALDADVLELQSTNLEHYKNFQRGFEEDLNSFEADVAVIEEKLQMVVENFCLSVQNDSEYLIQIKDRIIYLKEIINNDDVLDCTETSNIISELNFKLSAMKRGLKISTQNLDKYSSTLSRLEMLSHSSLVSCNSIGINLQEVIKNYQDKQLMFLEKLGKDLDFEGISNRWREMWTSDVQKVKDLYTVKYEMEKSEMIK